MIEFIGWNSNQAHLTPKALVHLYTESFHSRVCGSAVALSHLAPAASWVQAGSRSLVILLGPVATQ